MSIVRWKQDQNLMPLPSVLEGMQRNINRMFDSMFRGDRWDEEMAASLWTPAVDIVERDHDYVVKMDLPGVNRKEIQVTARQDVLTVKGEKKQEKETDDQNFHRVERSYGSFQRSFTLPGLARTDRIEASFKDGVLEIVVPKAEEAKAKSIEVRVS